MLLWILASLAQERPALETFKTRLAAARSAGERAAVLRELGDARDPAAVPLLGRYLAPRPDDVNCALPLAAAEGLGRLRGHPGAARALLLAAEASRRHPYLRARFSEALARVGHPAGLAVFGDVLKGPDPASAIRVIAAFPPDVAAEALLSEGRKIEHRGGEGVDRLRAELIKGLQRVTGEKYPSLAEFELWWKKRGASLNGKEAPPLDDGPVATLLVELAFRENGGMSTANTGASAGHYPACALGKGAPAWTGRVPVNGGPSALEWTNGTEALELGAGGVENLRGLGDFTLSGWILRSDAKEDGRRVLSWLGREGVDLALRADGRLQLGINQPAEASPFATPPGAVPVLDPKAEDPSSAWRFFAVTRDAGGVKFYLGGSNQDAALAAEFPGPTPAAGGKTAHALVIGNTPARNRGFRGVLDEIRVHGSALGLESLLRAQNRPID